MFYIHVGSEGVPHHRCGAYIWNLNKLLFANHTAFMVDSEDKLY